ncbi:hypothetical protein LXL04_033579 [Taraxacum kok-saghyz]
MRIPKQINKITRRLTVISKKNYWSLDFSKRNIRRITRSTWGTRAMRRRQFYSANDFVSGNRATGKFFRKDDIRIRQLEEIKLVYNYFITVLRVIRRMFRFEKSSDQYPHNDALTTYFQSMISFPKTRQSDFICSSGISFSMFCIICARVPRLRTGKTCLKSPPNIIIFPPKGRFNFVMSCIDRSTASTACLCAMEDSSHMIILVKYVFNYSHSITHYLIHLQTLSYLCVPAVDSLADKKKPNLFPFTACRTTDHVSV